MFVSITQAQFDGLKDRLSKLSEEPHGEVLEFHPGTDKNGVIKTKDAYIDYNYDPSFERLNIEIGKKLSLAAKIAPHQVIENHIAEALHALAIPIGPVYNQGGEKDQSGEGLDQREVAEGAPVLNDDSPKIEKPSVFKQPANS